MIAGLITPTRLDLKSPLGPNDLRILTAKVKTVQFSSPLTDAEYQRLAKSLSRHPKTELRIYGGWAVPFTNFDFLRHFPFLRRFDISVPLKDLSLLRLLPVELTHLTLRDPRDPKASFADLCRFRELRVLMLDGKLKKPDQIAGLKNLRSLTLRGAPLKDLSPLASLPHLRQLHLSGGKLDLQPLATLSLEALTLGRLTGPVSLSFLSGLTSLRILHLYWLRQLVSFPDLSHLRDLILVHLEIAKGLVGARGLAAAPNLTYALLSDVPSLNSSIRAAFARHSAIESLHIHPGGPTLKPGDNFHRTFTAKVAKYRD